jgi:hypothetical protein
MVHSSWIALMSDDVLFYLAPRQNRGSAMVAQGLKTFGGSSAVSDPSMVLRNAFILDRRE